MATLFFGVKGPTLDLRQGLQIKDSDAPRIIGYLMQSKFGKVTEEVSTPDASWEPDEKLGTTEADRPSIRAIVTRAATIEETAANYARHILSKLLDETVIHEKAHARAIADASIPPIDVVK